MSVTEGDFVDFFLFFAPISRIMVRKGWSVEDDLSKALWNRILMGPRPPSARWSVQQKGGQVLKRSQLTVSKPSVHVQQQGFGEGTVGCEVVFRG